MTSLIAVGWLGRLKPRQLAQPDALKHRRDRRERHVQTESDLRRGHPQTTQQRNDLHALLGSAMRDRQWRRRAIQQAGLAVGPIAGHPLRARAVADLGRRGGLRQRPPLIDNPTDHPPPLIQAERGVSVQLHPVSSLGLAASNTSSLQGGPRMNNPPRNYS